MDMGRAGAEDGIVAGGVCVCVCDGRLSFVDNVLTVTWRSVSDGHGSEKVDRLRVPGLCLRCSTFRSRTFSSLLHLPLILLPYPTLALRAVICSF